MKKKLNIAAIPYDFYNDFKNDTDNAMRNIGGWATTSIKPLFEDLNKFNNCLEHTLTNPFNERFITFTDNFKPEGDVYYYLHLDGSEGRDGYGICMCHLEGWTDEKPQQPVVKIDFLGAPNRNSYGDDFNLDLIDTLFHILVNRGFNIRMVTYDKATDIRTIQAILNDTIVGKMSLDRTANFYKINYDKAEPPYMDKVSTNGQYDMPFLDFLSVVTRENLIVPYHEGWYDIPYSLEHNMDKHLVLKISRKSDDLSQAVAGAIFNCLNNEKDSSADKTIEKQTDGQWEIRETPDTFNQMIEASKIRTDKPSFANNDKNFDKEPDIDEIGIDDDDFLTDMHRRDYL